jgi:hypothetical protein
VSDTCFNLATETCGEVNNIDLGYCSANDGACVVGCFDGVDCTRADCDPPPSCTPGMAGDETCETDCGSVCSDLGGVREAFCVDWGPTIAPSCDCICKAGPGSCLPDDLG